MKRSLRLRRETLAELTTDELYGVVGGTHAGCVATNDCTHETIDYCQPTPTLPVRDCLTLRTSCIQTCAGA
ncbi:MAG TPA: hypothetical protein VNQ77_00710 [Frankiaceae bacterium]|nr:hypothetical protein [Frankiaceae bacterium]